MFGAVGGAASEMPSRVLFFSFDEGSGVRGRHRDVAGAAPASLGDGRLSASVGNAAAVDTGTGSRVELRGSPCRGGSRAAEKKVSTSFMSRVIRPCACDIP